LRRYISGQTGWQWLRRLRSCGHSAPKKPSARTALGQTSAVLSPTAVAGGTLSSAATRYLHPLSCQVYVTWAVRQPVRVSGIPCCSSRSAHDGQDGATYQSAMFQRLKPSSGHFLKLHSPGFTSETLAAM